MREFAETVYRAVQESEWENGDFPYSRCVVSTRSTAEKTPPWGCREEALRRSSTQHLSEAGQKPFFEPENRDRNRRLYQLNQGAIRLHTRKTTHF